MMETKTNLDFEAARIARDIINETKGNKKNEVESLVTKTLGILEENGVYACMLFLYSWSKGKESQIAEVIRKHLFDWNGLVAIGKPQDGISLDFVANHICADLSTLLFVKKLWEQTLIYARYGAKARE